MEWLYLVLSICLIVIFIQDIKYRYVHVIFLILVFVSSILLIGNLSFDLIIEKILYNAFFFLLVFFVLFVYMSLKNKKTISPFKNYFGLGDFILYLAISPLFYLKNYIIFFIFSMLWALIIHGLATFYYKKETTIPLAGYTALLLQLLLLFELFFLPKRLLLS